MAPPQTESSANIAAFIQKVDFLKFFLKKSTRRVDWVELVDANFACKLLILLVGSTLSTLSTLYLTLSHTKNEVLKYIWINSNKGWIGWS